MPQYADLEDEEFDKIALKYNKERDVYGFITILSLTYLKEKHSFLKVILEYVIAKAEKYLTNDAKLNKLKSILKNKNVGLLMTERMINLPIDVVPSLHKELPDDLAFTKEQDDIDDPKEFDYDYLLVLSKYATKNQQTEDAEGQQRMYYKWEDEVFEKESEMSFTYLTTFADTDDNGKKVYSHGGGGAETQHKLVYLISFKEYLKQV